MRKGAGHVHYPFDIQPLPSTLRLRQLNRGHPHCRIVLQWGRRDEPAEMAGGLGSYTAMVWSTTCERPFRLTGPRLASGQEYAYISLIAKAFERHP